MSNTKTIAVVLSYNPEPSIVENIKVTLEQVSHVVVVDNQASPESKFLLDQVVSPFVTILSNQANLGVAAGFNQGIKWGLDNNFDFVLLLDQDSQIQSQMVQELIAAYQKISVGDEIVLLGPRYEDFERKLETTMPYEPIEQVQLLISSGSFFSKSLIDRVGLYDEKLFIDHVDHDFSLRVNKLGGRCYKINSAKMLHKLGTARVHRFLFKTFFIQDYSPFRRYFMMRNRIVLYQRYGIIRANWFWKDLNWALKDLIKLIFFESNKFEKLRAITRGVRDGLFWKDS